MRRIGSLPQASQAERFRDYMTTQSIDIAVDCAPADGATPGTTACDVWVRDESQVARARELFDEFRASPEDPRFQVAAEAQRIRHQRATENVKKLKFQRQAPLRRAGAGLGGMTMGGARQQSIPLTIAILVLSVLASFATNFGRPKPSTVRGEYSTEEKIYCALGFVDPRIYDGPEDSFASVKQGELWRFITPLFLHGNTLHLLFNMLWIFTLGSLIERMHGSLFFLVLTLLTQIVGMVVQVFFPEALGGSPFAIGASGAVYGLFGYLWIRPLIDPGYPIRMAPMNVALMLGWLVLCFTPMIPGVANGAHLGGLVAGVAAAPLVAQRRV